MRQLERISEGRLFQTEKIGHKATGWKIPSVIKEQQEGGQCNLNRALQGE